MVSRNDPCPCGSGKKYKKCCLEADAASLARLTSASIDVYTPAALCLAGDSRVPAIVCENEANNELVFILARASHQMDALEAAEEADADLTLSPDSAPGEVGPACLRHLHKIGYRIMPGLKVDDVELLQDLLDEVDDNQGLELLDLLGDTAEQQIREKNPPEVRQTLVRLRRAGYSRADVIDMIVHVMMHESIDAAREEGELNVPRYTAALLRLPEIECADQHLDDDE